MTVMKKILIIAAIVCFGIGISSAIERSTPETRIETCETESNVIDITVYKLTKVGNTAWSETAKSARYNRDEHVIYIREGRHEMTYNVNDNIAYNNSGDARSKYRYVAGGYYFNL